MKLIILLSLIITSGISFGQNDVKIMLHGHIFDKQKEAVNEALIEVLKDGNVVSESTTDDNGKYNFVPAGPGVFTMKISKKGHTTKSFIIDQSCEEIFDGELLEFSLDLELQKLSKTTPKEYPPATIFDCHK